MTGTNQPPVPPVLTYQETQYLLATDLLAAEARARSILSHRPADAGALHLLGAALRRQERRDEARRVLESLVASQPDMVVANFELGLLLAETGGRERAILHFAAAVEFAPQFFDAWFALAGQLALRDSPATDSLSEALQALKTGRRADAASQVASLVTREPGNATARFLYATLLLVSDRAGLAANEAGLLVEREPDNANYRALHAAALYANGEFARAVEAFEALLKLTPARPGTWMAYGRALRAIGRKGEAVAAFRKAYTILPASGDPWRTLASVKGFRFEPAEMQKMREILGRSDLRVPNRTQLHYALAKAEEGEGHYAEAFAEYEASNALQKASSPSFSAEGPADFVRRSKAMFTRAFFDERAGAGSLARDPIFIVGLPRSGTTLVEQIVSSHPEVEGLEELQFLGMTAARIADAKPGETIDAYLDRVPMVAKERLRELGEYYLGLAASRRKSAKPFFTDKLPNNFLHIGLLHLILPNARVIDVRRSPLDCCMSCFSSYFVFPQPFAHSLSDLGHYYADYVALMDHYGRVLPKQLHRVVYDDLVQHPEREIRRILGFLELSFDERCLRSHENERSVRTLSAEQVRRPIYAESVGAWRRYDPWLEPLKSALGDALESWRGAANNTGEAA